MDEGLIIRDLTTADIAAAQAIMMRSVVEDFGASHDPELHADIDDLYACYVEPSGPFMLVVEDTTTGQVVATGGIRDGAFNEARTPAHLAHLAKRYRDGRTGQIVRVYVLKEHRRRHIARAVVEAIFDRARHEGHYDTIALHTYPHSPGALPFWLSMGCELVEDDSHGPTREMYFEFALLPRPDNHDRAGVA